MAEEQRDVMEKKDHVTKSSRGLQQWGHDPASPTSGGAGTGAGGAGTAERAARITEGQERAKDNVGRPGRQSEQVGTEGEGGKLQSRRADEPE